MRDQNTFYKIVANVNIYDYPTKLRETSHPNRKTQITIGDLHGNAIKFIHFLVAENLLGLSEKSYDNLVAIYKKENTTLTFRDFETFNLLLAEADASPIGMIRLIGDEVADRGKNDLFTLLVFKNLRQKKINYEILFSNHGLTFLEAYQFPDKTEFELQFSLGINSISLTNLQVLIPNVIQPSTLINLVENDYKFFLKAISYSIDTKSAKPKMTIYSHAPIGMETIETLAAHYAIPYDPNTLPALCNIIDMINENFQRDLQQQTLLEKKQFSEATLNYHRLGAETVRVTDPLLRIAWNRSAVDSEINTFSPSNAFDVEFVHGHEGPLSKDVDNLNSLISVRPNMKNLDASYLGRDGLEKINASYIVAIKQD